MLKALKYTLYGNKTLLFSQIDEICYSSNEAFRGAAFFCLTGSKADGHSFAHEAYKKGVYNLLNTRQEGGMGLYKIMLILYKTTNDRDAFYISLNDHKVKVKIKMPKEFIANEKNSVKCAVLRING